MAFDDLTPNQSKPLIQIIEAVNTGNYSDEFAIGRTLGRPQGYVHLYGISGVDDKEIEGCTDSDIQTLKDEGYLTVISGGRGSLKAKAFQEYRLQTHQSRNEAPQQSLVTARPLPLEKEQEDLLSAVVEAYRNVPRESREPFIVRTFDDSHNAEIRHQGLPDGKIRAYEGDLKILCRYELLAPYSQREGIYIFDINPEGFAYYAYLKGREGKPARKVENSLKDYIEADRFRQKYSKAYQKWKGAEVMLWNTDSEDQLTTIGHLCREALQEFAATLVDHHQPPNLQADKTKTVAQLRAILNQYENRLGSTERPFLDALLAYWGTVSNLIQRQEHGGHKEGQALVWEDGRRVVFQTLIVMFEIDSSLSRGAS